jgi:hypothetical protein
MTQDFKAAYADHWQAGNTRERYVRALLELVGYRVEPYGFMAEQDTFNSERNREVGKPDYRISVNNLGPDAPACDVCFVEVTGTEKLGGKRNQRTVWVRPDKVQWAKVNPTLPTYLAHVENLAVKVRWLRMLDVGECPVEEIRTEKGLERFHVVPEYRCMTTLQFLADLQGEKRT